MTITERIEHLRKRFSQLNDWQERYAEIIKIGKELPELPESGRQAKFLVKGCQSQVWLYPQLEDGKVHYHADSDAAITKGIIAMLVRVYSESSPDAIIENKQDFLSELGITDHLSMNRTNGLKAMGKQIKMYALAYKVTQ